MSDSYHIPFCQYEDLHEKRCCQNCIYFLSHLIVSRLMYWLLDYYNQRTLSPSFGWYTSSLVSPRSWPRITVSVFCWRPSALEQWTISPIAGEIIKYIFLPQGQGQQRPQYKWSRASWPQLLSPCTSSSLQMNSFSLVVFVKLGLVGSMRKTVLVFILSWSLAAFTSVHRKLELNKLQIRLCQQDFSLIDCKP